MLWAAGQKRVSREAQQRLGELYVGVRDGYVAGLVASGQAKATGSGYVPEYLQPEGSSRSRRGLTQLMADFPAALVGKPEFTN